MTNAAVADPPVPPDDTDDNAGSGGVYKRITVNLTKKTSDALESACQLSDCNQTDNINLAIQHRNLLLQIQNKPGGAIYIRDGEGAELERLRLL